MLPPSGYRLNMLASTACFTSFTEIIGWVSFIFQMNLCTTQAAGSSLFIHWPFISPPYLHPSILSWLFYNPEGILVQQRLASPSLPGQVERGNSPDSPGPAPSWFRHSSYFSYGGSVHGSWTVARVNIIFMAMLLLTQICVQSCSLISCLLKLRTLSRFLWLPATLQAGIPWKQG